MARANEPRSNRSRGKRDLVQKANLNAPGGASEAIARANETMDDRDMTGGMGADRRRKPWYYGLGYEMITNPEQTVRMAPMPSNEIPPKHAKMGAPPRPRGKGASDEIT